MCPRSISMIFPSAILALTIAPALALSGAPRALAQAVAQEQNSPTAAGESTSQASEGASKKEEAEGGSQDTFRHSNSVKAVARMTGLSVDQAYWACVVVNFAIVAGLLWFLLRKSLPGIFQSRSETIQKRIEEARRASEEARRRIAEVESRLARLDSEIEKMRQEADTASHAEEERLQSSAREEQRRIVQAAEQEIAMAANQARRELKAYAADLAVSLAEKKIKIGLGTDQVLVREFAQQLGKDAN